MPFADSSNTTVRILSTPTHRIYTVTWGLQGGETQAVHNLREPVGGWLDRYETRFVYDGGAPVTPSIRLCDEHDADWFGGLTSGELRSMTLTASPDVTHSGAFYAGLGNDRAARVGIMGRPVFVVDSSAPSRGVFKMFLRRF